MCADSYTPAEDALSCTGCMDNCLSCADDAALCDDGMCMPGYTQNEDMSVCL